MKQLAESMEEMTAELRGLRGDLEDVVDVLGRERWWRKVAAALVVAGFVSVAAFISHTRQADCDRNNRAREQIRAANVAGFGTAWDELAGDDPEARADLLAEIAADQETVLPPRDCAWPA